VQAMQFRHHWMLAFWGMLESHLAYHRLSQIFDNKEAPRKVRYWNSQKNETWEFNTRGRFQPNQWLDGFIGMEFMQEKLNQENLLYPAASIGEKVRRIQSYYQSLHFSIRNIPMLVSSLHLRETLRYEKIFEKRGRWFPSLGVSLVPYFWQQKDRGAWDFGFCLKILNFRKSIGFYILKKLTILFSGTVHLMASGNHVTKREWKNVDGIWK